MARVGDVAAPVPRSGRARARRPRGRPRGARRVRSSSGSESAASGGDGKSVSISNWTSYMDRRSRRRTSPKDTGHQAHLHRGHQRQQRVLRQDPAEPAASDQSIGRDGFVLTDWMANRMINQVKWVQPFDAAKFPNKANLRAAARVTRRSTRPASTARRGRAASPGSPTTSRRTGQGDQDDRRLPRGRRARRRCSPRCATPSGSSCVRSRHRHRQADLRRGRAGVRQAAEGVRATARSTASTATST